MQEHAKILIIEDDADINGIVASHLGKNGFVCTQAFSGSEAKLVIEGAARDGVGSFDIVICDLMLPGMSGQDLISLIRTHTQTPIIVISALDSPMGKVEVLGLGADDYLVKPFDLDELAARVLVQLRHSGSAAAEGGATIRFRGWVIDCEARTLVSSGEEIKLTRTEFNIVEALARRPKKVFSKRELYEAAWNEDCFIEEKAINVHVSNIRAKLKRTGTDDYIETVWGIGFKLSDE